MSRQDGLKHAGADRRPPDIPHRRSLVTPITFETTRASTSGAIGSCRQENSAWSTAEPPGSMGGGSGTDVSTDACTGNGGGDGRATGKVTGRDGGSDGGDGNDCTRRKTRERSEELAKASAATWEQFQHLLKRSRESKHRFDRVMDRSAAAETTAAATSKKTLAVRKLRPRPGKEKTNDGYGSADGDRTKRAAAGHGAADPNVVDADPGRTGKISSSAAVRSKIACGSSGSTTPSSSVLGSPVATRLPPGVFIDAARTRAAASAAVTVGL
ncbi:unnamed protein product, partial [Sphacelaria rigidula]